MSNEKLLLIAYIFIPDLENDESLKKAFWINFQTLWNDFDHGTQARLKMLVKVIYLLSYLFNFKSFHALSTKSKYRYVDRLFQFPVGKFVAGINGLRSLCMISYYNIDAIQKEINYTIANG